MGFWQLVLVEGLILLAAGTAFLGGLWGIMSSGLVLSGLNFLNHGKESFWTWEIPLIAGMGIGLLVLYFLNSKAQKSLVFSGMVGGLASLVLFAAFITPLLALLFWALIIGAGLLPRKKRKDIFWGMAPTAWRVVLGIACIVYGNFLTIGI